MFVDSADPNLVPSPFFPPFDPGSNTSEPSLALITHNVVAMRAEPRSGSEQVSQAILGDSVVCLAVAEEYMHVRTADGYEGWVWRGSLMPLDADSPCSNWPFSADTGTPCYIQSDITPLRLAPDRPETLLTRLVCGTRLLAIDFVSGAQPGDIAVRIPSGRGKTGRGKTGRGKTGRGKTGTERTDPLRTGYVPAGALAPLPAQRYPHEFTGESACTLARRFLGVPYLWGGTTTFGFDCSGFVQRVYSLLNLTLPRDAYQQAVSPLGTRFEPTTPTEPGDLVFFVGRSDPRKRGITHVGMALDTERFIHAVGKEGVIITPFDDPYYGTQYQYVGGWRLILTGAVRAADS